MKRRDPRITTTILISIAAAVPAGCAGPKHVSFPTSDGGVVHADLSVARDRGVVLAHGGRFNKDSWATQAQVLAKAGFRTLAIDFRGRGQSRGGPQATSADDVRFDVLAAVRYLHDNGRKDRLRRRRQLRRLGKKPGHVRFPRASRGVSPRFT